MTIKINSLVRPKIDTNYPLWRVKEINKGLSGKTWYFCVVASDTKLNTGFDSIGRSFLFHEIDLD
tara:strand:+ start:89 stop:283 length:195 start_codon:yes stop_codon:yes gene_type:complete